MSRWIVEYQGPDKKVRQTGVTVDDKYTTAVEVQTAIGKGEIPELVIQAGAILMVKKGDPVPVNFRVGRA